MVGGFSGCFFLCVQIRRISLWRCNKTTRVFLHHLVFNCHIKPGKVVWFFSFLPPPPAGHSPPPSLTSLPARARGRASAGHPSRTALPARPHTGLKLPPSGTLSGVNLNSKQHRRRTQFSSTQLGSLSLPKCAWSQPLSPSAPFFSLFPSLSSCKRG